MSGFFPSRLVGHVMEDGTYRRSREQELEGVEEKEHLRTEQERQLQAIGFGELPNTNHVQHQLED